MLKTFFIMRSVIKLKTRLFFSQGDILSISILSSLLAAQTAVARQLIDMVYVDTESLPSSQRSSELKPFYIEIFETTGAEASALTSGISYTSRKPGRMTLGQATDVCRKKGMRLPTKEEWLAAASNVGANKRFSLRGDTIHRPDGALAVNISTGDSMHLDDPRIGLDAIGTIAMTGNRAEYFLNRNGQGGLCGGEYETQSGADVELVRICEQPINQRSTARCVVEAGVQPVKIKLSNRLAGERRSYIESLAKKQHFNRVFDSRFEDFLIGSNSSNSADSADSKEFERDLDAPSSPFEPF